MTWYQTRNFWSQLIKSCNVPFNDEKLIRENEIREIGLNVLLNFDYDNISFSSKKRVGNKFDTALEPIKRMIVEDEFKYRSRKKLEELLFQKSLNKYQDELKITQIQISRLSKDLAKQQVSISSNIQFFSTEEIQEISNNTKSDITTALSKADLTSIELGGIIVRISSLLGFIFEQIVGQKSPNFNKAIYLIKEANNNLLSQKEIETLKNFRIIRNGYIHTIKDMQKLTQNEIEALTQEIFIIIEKLLLNKTQLLNDISSYNNLNNQSNRVIFEKTRYDRADFVGLGLIIILAIIIAFMFIVVRVDIILINGFNILINEISNVIYQIEDFFSRIAKFITSFF